MQVDTNIPIPVKTNWKASIGDLKVKQSIGFDKDDRNTVAATVSNHFHKITKKRFTISADPTDSSRDRIWRVK